MLKRGHCGVLPFGLPIKLLFLVLLPAFGFSQSTTTFRYQSKDIVLEEKVKTHFGEESTSRMIQDNPEGLIYQHFYAVHSYTILNNHDKKEDFISISQIAYTNKFIERPKKITRENFNVLDFDLSLKESSYVILLDDGTAILIKSKKLFYEDFRTYLKTLE